MADANRWKVSFSATPLPNPPSHQLVLSELLLVDVLGAGSILPQRMGIGRAPHLMLTGQIVDGETAFGLGLVEPLSS
jgi:hypothetical protein